MRLLSIVIIIIIVLSLHPDTFSFIAITSDSNKLSELIQEVKQMYFETGTGQSLKRRPVWKNRGRLSNVSLSSHRGGSGSRTHRGAAPCHRIPTRREGGPASCSRKGRPMSARPSRIVCSVFATSHACSYMPLPFDAPCRTS